MACKICGQDDGDDTSMVQSLTDGGIRHTECISNPRLWRRIREIEKRIAVLEAEKVRGENEIAENGRRE
jgi:ribonuclease HI